jgi:Rrf2 family protein
MRINKSFEQAVYVLTMLALQKEHRPVKSSTLSTALEVSDSYLKKILVKLTKSGLIVSSASKTGGYQLARKTNQISLRDIFLTLEPDAKTIEFKHMAQHVYDDATHVAQVEALVMQTLEGGLDDFLARLDTVHVNDLLLEEATIDWSERYPAH